VTAETSRLVSLRADAEKQMNKAKERLTETEAEAAKVAQMAQEAVQDGNLFRKLQARKNFYYLVTRINWQMESDGDKKVRGFVINPVKSDIISFKLDKRDSYEQYLWDCIAAGTDPAWKNV
jgi:uncharacterized protein YfcZ (UPF0381/DUF406 family)